MEKFVEVAAKRPEDESKIMRGTEADAAADFANYFCSYASVYHQKIMLMDHVRMTAYHSAITSNRSLFEGKVVMDCGAGSGVLSIWAAQAGAAKVYAIEFTDMANHARRMVERNGLSHIVEVIQSSIEDVVLPCKVDFIVSEWMGYMMLRESMLDSVIRARDKWMKPEGSMFPSHATLFFGAISNEDDRKAKQREYTHSLEEVRRFSGEMKQYYNLDTSTLEPVLEREMEEYYIYSALWTELKPESVVGTPKTILKLDLNTCTLADVQGVPTTPFSFQIPAPAQAPLNVSGFAGWFTTDFWGSTATPVVNRVTLSTGPEMGYTHWGQHVFYFKAPVVIRSETTANNSKTSQYRTNIHGTVEMVRQPKNQRLYRLNVSTRVNDAKAINQVYDIP